MWFTKSLLSGFFPSFKRIVTNKVVMLQTLAMACVSTAIFSFVRFDKAFIQVCQKKLLLSLLLDQLWIMASFAFRRLDVSYLRYAWVDWWVALLSSTQWDIIAPRWYWCLCSVTWRKNDLLPDRPMAMDWSKGNCANTTIPLKCGRITHSIATVGNGHHRGAQWQWRLVGQFLPLCAEDFRTCVWGIHYDFLNIVLHLFISNFNRISKLLNSKLN